MRPPAKQTQQGLKAPKRLLQARQVRLRMVSVQLCSRGRLARRTGRSCRCREGRCVRITSAISLRRSPPLFPYLCFCIAVRYFGFLPFTSPRSVVSINAITTALQGQQKGRGAPGAPPWSLIIWIRLSLHLQREPFYRKTSACAPVDLYHNRVHLQIGLAYLELGGHAGQKTVDDGVLLHSDNPTVATGHTHV